MKSSASHLVVFSLIVLCSMSARLAWSQKTYDNDIFNFGVKLGLNALSSTSYKIYFEDSRLDNGKVVNKEGYHINAFARINLDKFFMQPEFEWARYKQNCVFALPISLEENTYEKPQTLNVKENTANVYVLVGYHIVKNGPYIINAYLGGGGRLNYKTKYELRNTPFTDKDNRYNYSGIIGTSMNIGIIHFDIRYHFNFPNTNIKLSEINGAPDNYKDISFKKNENILSFSCGVMF